MMEITDRNFVGRHKREPSDYVKYRKKITTYARKKRREDQTQEKIKKIP